MRIKIMLISLHKKVLHAGYRKENIRVVNEADGSPHEDPSNVRLRFLRGRRTRTRRSQKKRLKAGLLPQATKSCLTQAMGRH
jgi:hypothetical protein